MLSGWLTPHRLLLGAVGLAASCAALGLSAARAPESSASPARTTRPGGAASTERGYAARAEKTPRSPCPAEMVLVDRTCVDRYEAHLLEQDASGALVPHPAHEQPEHGRFVAASSAGSKPQAFICQVDAGAACENAGKRLCSLSEWYRACTGSAHTTYPYGAKYEKGRCNVGKPHLLSLLHGASVSGWSYADFNDPKLALTPGFLALTGEYADCQSDEGVHDMVGNLHEWVADHVDGTLRTKLPNLGVIQGRIGRHRGNGIFMGGFFSTLKQHGEGCNFVTAAHDPAYHDYSTGFRCCKDAEPSQP